MNEQIEQIIQFIKEQIAIEERRVEKAHWDTQESHAQGAIEAFENVIKFIEEH